MVVLIIFLYVCCCYYYYTITLPYKSTCVESSHPYRIRVSVVSIQPSLTERAVCLCCPLPTTTTPLNHPHCVCCSQHSVAPGICETGLRPTRRQMKTAFRGQTRRSLPTPQPGHIFNIHLHPTPPHPPPRVGRLNATLSSGHWTYVV